MNDLNELQSNIYLFKHQTCDFSYTKFLNINLTTNLKDYNINVDLFILTETKVPRTFKKP